MYGAQRKYIGKYIVLVHTRTIIMLGLIKFNIPKSTLHVFNDLRYLNKSPLQSFFLERTHVQIMSFIELSIEVHFSV